MRILYLGPACPAIESRLATMGHCVERIEAPLHDDFLCNRIFDFVISYRYQHIISAQIVQHFERRIINLHISMLPWNRGNDPNLWSFLENTPKGVTIHIINEGLDKGDILLQQEVTLDVATDTLRTSWEKLSRAIETLFLENAEDLLAGNIQPKPQAGKGSYHRTCDKMRYIDLIEELWWDTPVKMLEGVTLSRACARKRKKKKGSGVILRKAAWEDATFLFQFMTNGNIRKYFFTDKPVTWVEHCLWLENTLRRRVPFFIAEQGGLPIGYIRFQPGPEEYEISIAVLPEYAGQGQGEQIVKIGCQMFFAVSEQSSCVALVMGDNMASMRLFRKCHFQAEKAANIAGHTCICYRYPSYNEETACGY